MHKSFLACRPYKNGQQARFDLQGLVQHPHPLTGINQNFLSKNEFFLLEVSGDCTQSCGDL